MKLLVIGATRGVGKEVVAQGLAEGHAITALARDPASVAVAHERLAVMKGDIYDLASIREAVRGQDAVVSSIGPTFAESRREVTLYSKGGANILAAMQDEGVKRGVFVTSGGVEAADPGSSWFFRTVFRGFLLKGGYEDQIRFEALVKASSLDWTLVRPTRLGDGPKKPYRVSPRFAPPGGGDIGRADVADFILRELGSNAFIHGTPTLAY